MDWTSVVSILHIQEIYNLLSENVRNNIRVTKSHGVIHSLNEYFATLCEI